MGQHLAVQWGLTVYICNQKESTTAGESGIRDVLHDLLTHNNDRRLFNGRAVVGRLLQSSPSQNYLLLIPTLPTNTPTYTLLWKHSIFSLLCTLVASIHSYLVLISPHNSILLAKVYLSPHRRQCVSSPPSPL